MGVSNPSPRPDHIAQGSSTGKIHPHNFWLEKSVGVGAAEENARFLELCLKGPDGLKTYRNPPSLRFNTRETAGRAPVICREWVK